MSKINVSTITNRTGTSGPVLSGVTTATNGFNVTGGSVGIGTDNPDVFNPNADDLVIFGTGHQGLTIRSGNTHDGSIMFNDTDNANQRGIIRYIHGGSDGTDTMAFHTSGGEALRIDSLGSAQFQGSNRPTGLDTRISQYGSLLVATSGDLLSNARCSIDSGNGNITTIGNLIVANGKGIDFSATGDTAGATSELLDDYEEGLHTTVFTDTGSGTITVSTSNDQLSYVKIGNLVTITGRPTVDSVSSPTGYLRMTLPFTSADVSDAGCRAAGSVNLRLVESGYDVGLFSTYIDESSNILTLNYGGSTDNTPSGPAMKLGTQIWISITYRTT